VARGNLPGSDPIGLKVQTSDAEIQSLLILVDFVWNVNRVVSRNLNFSAF
jgi:hypothetical protein